MANAQVTIGSGTYVKATGAGTNVDPHIIEHLETNSAAILANGVADIQAQIDGTNRGLVVQPTGTNCALRFYSVDNATGKPSLTITYTE